MADGDSPRHGARLRHLPDGHHGQVAVVDPQGRVLGVDGLYVADASVFPEVPRANTNLPTITAAERLSDLIRDAAGGAGRADVYRVAMPPSTVST